MRRYFVKLSRVKEHRKNRKQDGHFSELLFEMKRYDSVKEDEGLQKKIQKIEMFWNILLRYGQSWLTPVLVKKNGRWTYKTYCYD